MPGLPLDVLKRPENRKCADCEAHDPRWASINLGILICETCCGIHRNLGTHISRVKSVKLDEWKPEWVAIVRAIGNGISNTYYEYQLMPGIKYVGNVNSAGGDRIDEVEARKLNFWIRAKYEHKRFARPGVDEPSQRYARGELLDAHAGIFACPGAAARDSGTVGDAPLEGTPFAGWGMQDGSRCQARKSREHRHKSRKRLGVSSPLAAGRAFANAFAPDWALAKAFAPAEGFTNAFTAADTAFTKAAASAKAFTNFSDWPNPIRKERTASSAAGADFWEGKPLRSGMDGKDLAAQSFKGWEPFVQCPFASVVA